MIQTGIEALKWTIEMVAQWKIWIIYGISIFYVLFFSRNSKEKDYGFISLIGIFFIFNPLFAGLAVKFFFSYTRYFRILWVLPIYFVIAMAAAEISEKRGKAAVCLCTCIICIAGSFMFIGNFELPENMYKVPQAAVDVCEYFRDTEEYQNGELKISAEPVLSTYIRQVDGNINLQFGREGRSFSTSIKSEVAFYQMYNSDVEEINVPILIDAIRYDHCQYLVIDEGKVNREEMLKYGYKFIDMVDEYEIYKAL